MRTTPLLTLALLASFFLAGCVEGEQSGAVVASEVQATATPSPTPQQDMNALLPGDSVFAFGSGKPSEPTPTPAAATATPATATASATATPTPTATPTATPTPTPTPAPSLKLPDAITDSGAPSDIYAFTCAKQGPSCDEVVAAIFSGAFAEYYAPSNADHAKDSRYYFFKTKNFQSMTNTMLRYCARYYPGDNAYATYGYSSGFKTTC